MSCTRKESPAFRRGEERQDMAWMDDGACQEVGGEFWFPEKGEKAREAKAICAGCGVVDECLDYAIDNQVQSGVWGGLTTRERRAVYRPAHAAWPSPTSSTLRTEEQAMSTRVFHPLTEPELAAIRAELAALNVPVTLDMDGDVCVMHTPDGLPTHAEVRAMRLVEARTDGFRRDQG